MADKTQEMDSAAYYIIPNTYQNTERLAFEMVNPDAKDEALVKINIEGNEDPEYMIGLMASMLESKLSHAVRI